jgi:hypothetical protein
MTFLPAFLPAFLPSLLSLLAAPAQAAQAPPSSPRAAEIVLRVDERPVERSAFEPWLVTQRGEGTASLFASHWLIAREARRLGVDEVAEEARAKAEAEIKERVDKALGGDMARWEEELRASFRTPLGRRVERILELERDLRVRNLAALDRVVPQEKIERDWKRIYGPEGRRFRVRLLYRRLTVPALPGLTREKQEAEQQRLRDELVAQASKLRERALSGEPFTALVRDHSEDKLTRASGGRPEGSFLDPRGWPEEALDKLAALPPGGISEPIFAMGGVWLVQLEELIETPLASVEGELRAALEARGPEPDELAATAARLSEGVAWEILPAMLGDEAAGAEAPDPPVMRIDGVDVGRAEHTRWLVRAFADSLARRFGEDWLLELMAEDAGIAITPEEIEARIDADLDQMIDFYHKGDRAAWERDVVRQHGSVDAWRRRARKQGRMDQIVAELLISTRTITDDVVRQVWIHRYGIDGVELQVRLIRIDAVAPDVPPDTPPEEVRRLGEEALEAAQKSAADLAQRVRDGEDFAALAKRFSTDAATRANGGELPAGADIRALPPDVAEAVEVLEPGGVAGPVRAGTSFFVVELMARREVPFDSVKDALRKELEQAPPSLVDLRGHRNVLTRDVRVEVLPALFD